MAKDNNYISINFNDAQLALEAWHILNKLNLIIDKPGFKKLNDSDEVDDSDKYIIKISFVQLSALISNQKLEIDDYKKLDKLVNGENIRALVGKFGISTAKIQLYGDETVFFYFNSEESVSEFKQYIKSNFPNLSAYLKEYLIDNSIEIQRHQLEIINKRIDLNKSALEEIKDNDGFKLFTSNFNFSKIEFNGVGDVAFNFESLEEAAVFEAHVRNNFPEPNIIVDNKCIKIQLDVLTMIAEELTKNTTERAVGLPVTRHSFFFAPANQIPNVASSNPSPQEASSGGRNLPPKFNAS